MHWLLTRPAEHNQALAARIAALGQSVSVAPALAVLPWCDDAQAGVWEQLAHMDALLFTSINAVEQFAQELARREQAWPAATCLAIGRATADALATHGRTATCPATGFTSEDLLALPLIASFAGKSLLLVSGVGGRGLLAPSLVERGVKVTRLDVYRRVCSPDFAWPAQKVDGLLVTSLESWHCLLDKAGAALRDCVVIAGSARIAASVAPAARKTFTAASPSDDDMLAVLMEICR